MTDKNRAEFWQGVWRGLWIGLAVLLPTMAVALKVYYDN